MPLPVQSMNFADGQSWYRASWHGRSVDYICGGFSTGPITGEVYIVGQGGRWFGGEVRLRDVAGVVELKGFIFDRGEVIEDDLLGSIVGGTGLVDA